MAEKLAASPRTLAAWCGFQQMTAIVKQPNLQGTRLAPAEHGIDHRLIISFGKAEAPLPLLRKVNAGRSWRLVEYAENNRADI